MNSTRASVSHHARLIEELRDDPTFAREYLAEALAQADEPGGREALLLVLRQLAEAHGGMAKIAEAASVSPVVHAKAPCTPTRYTRDIRDPGGGTDMGANLYDTDFCAWAQRQAELIRAGRLEEVDFEHVAEEIESMGKSDAREAASRLTVLLAHLLKWQHQPQRRALEISGRSWLLTLREQRRSLAKLFRDSPSLRARLPELIADAYPDAAEFARLETGLIDPQWSPDECPYSPADVMNDSFLPE